MVAGPIIALALYTFRSSYSLSYMTALIRAAVEGELQSRSEAVEGVVQLAGQEPMYQLPQRLGIDLRLAACTTGCTSAYRLRSHHRRRRDRRLGSERSTGPTPEHSQWRPPTRLTQSGRRILMGAHS